jgi:hypothetical protein
MVIIQYSSRIATTQLEKKDQIELAKGQIEGTKTTITMHTKQ